jgi:hypothetical protein
LSNRKWTSWHHHQIVRQDQTHVYFETNQSPLTNDTHNIVHPGKQHRSHRTKLHETSLQDGDDERNDPYYSQVSAAGDHHIEIPQQSHFLISKQSIEVSNTLPYLA